MANGQNTDLVAALGAAWMGAPGVGSALAGAAGTAAAGGTAKGKGANTMSGLLSAGNAGPSSSDALFGSPFSMFDSSGWNVTFGPGSQIAASVGDRSASNSPSASAGYGDSVPAAPASVGFSDWMRGADSSLLIVGVIVVAMIAARGR